MHEHHERRAGAGLGPFEHLLIAGRVAERGLWAATNDEVDSLWLTALVVDQEHFGQLDQFGFAVLAVFIFDLGRGPDHLFRWDAVDRLGEDPYEFLPTS